VRHPQPVGTPGGFEEVWRTANHLQSPPLGAHGVFPCAYRVFPDAALPPARARGAAGLGRCSPKSSVPRQTVGHHARAAMYEMGLTTACEGRRGEVPRQSLDIPPTGACSVPFSYTHRPGCSGAHGPAGSWVDFPIPQNPICMGFAKNGLASSQPRRCAPRCRRGVLRRPERRTGPRDHPVYPYCCSQAPAAALPAPFSYTHRPRCSGRHGPAGSWVDFPIPQNSFVCVLLKMGSRARNHAAAPGGPPRPGLPRARPAAAPQGGGWAPRAAYPTPRPTYPMPRPAYPAPRAAYPTPRRPPRTPRSAPQPAYPTPAHRPVLPTRAPRPQTSLPYTYLPRAPPNRLTLYLPPTSPPRAPRPAYPIPPLHSLPSTPHTPACRQWYIAIVNDIYLRYLFVIIYYLYIIRTYLYVNLLIKTAKETPL
jgi:hypothetical protein